MLTRKGVLALGAVLDIACHARPEPVSTRDIAARQKIARRTLEHVMQPLVKAGILKGQRGPKGGYWLGRERRRISAGDILRAAEPEMGEADETMVCAQSLILEYLDRVSLEELSQKQGRENPAPVSTKGFNFTI